MPNFCSNCGLPQNGSSAGYCSQCGRELIDTVSNSDRGYQRKDLGGTDRPATSENTTSSVNVIAIIVLVAMEIIGDNIARSQGATLVPVVLWAVSTAVGLYLIGTRNWVNRLVGGIKIVMYVTWVGGLLFTLYNNRLSGTYQGVAGMTSMSFTPDGHFTYNLTGADTSVGTYKIQGDTLILDPTSGQAANDPSVANSPLYQSVISALQGTVSADRRTVTIGGAPYTKQ